MEDDVNEENVDNEENRDNDNQTELAKLDKDIKRMERKLGINKEKQKEQFKKRLTKENYDDDFLDFLDHIEDVVKEEKGIKPDSSKKAKTKIMKNEKEDVQIKEDIPIKSNDVKLETR